MSEAAAQSQKALFRAVASLALLIPLVYIEAIVLGVWMLGDGNQPLLIAIGTALVIGACCVFGVVKRRERTAFVQLALGWAAAAAIFAISHA